MILVSAIRLMEEKMFWFSQDTPWFVSLVTRTNSVLAESKIYVPSQVFIRT